MKKSNGKKTLTPESMEINKTIAHVEQVLKDDEGSSPALIDAVRSMLLLVKLLTGRLGLNSKNSSKPPSDDKNSNKNTSTKGNSNKQGGQTGHKGSTLELVNNPDKVIPIKLDTDLLPDGNYQDAGIERRQYFDIKISRVITEYQAQILINEQGKKFVAKFPDGLTQRAQYGGSVKANAVYMSMFQLVPYDRVQLHFNEMYNIPISTGSLFNFNKLAYHRLAKFEEVAKQKLIVSDLIHADETGINVNGSRIWLHNASNNDWTLIAPHEKRGKLAMDEIDILPHFTGVLCHDHWKPYYNYQAVKHSLCNAHHLRELVRAHEQDDQHWAKEMHTLLTELNITVDNEGGVLSMNKVELWQIRYRKLLDEADIECPPPPPHKNEEGVKKRGLVARSKARNLLERLRNFEDDVLLFMKEEHVPFTNNQGERDIRMTKVHQKISGCFRSMEGAKIFCRIRSYISTCQKNGVGVGQAIDCLMNGDALPDFIQNEIDQLQTAE
ncbi:MAG: IS66 family transposase [Alteromonadales bacterium]|nr:IS66 family transposase [Alteromonadales bacterium]